MRIKLFFEITNKSIFYLDMFKLAIKVYIFLNKYVKLLTSRGGEFLTISSNFLISDCCSSVSSWKLEEYIGSYEEEQGGNGWVVSSSRGNTGSDLFFFIKNLTYRWFQNGSELFDQQMKLFFVSIFVKPEQNEYFYVTIYF